LSKFEIIKNWSRIGEMFDLLAFSASVIIGAVVLFIIAPLFIPIEIVESYSKILYNLFLGFGALFGGLGSLKYLNDYYLKQRDRNKKIRELKKKYPDSEFDITWDVIASSDNTGRIFIRDLKNNVVHHVGNYPTYLDLGLRSYKTKRIDVSDFLEYPQKEPHRTRADE
jgi:hypothetical protein